jgi:hypothetical protein
MLTHVVCRRWSIRRLNVSAGPTNANHRRLPPPTQPLLTTTDTTTHTTPKRHRRTYHTMMKSLTTMKRRAYQLTPLIVLHSLSALCQGAVSTSLFLLTPLMHSPSADSASSYSHLVCTALVFTTVATFTFFSNYNTPSTPRKPPYRTRHAIAARRRRPSQTGWPLMTLLLTGPLAVARSINQLTNFTNHQPASRRQRRAHQRRQLQPPTISYSTTPTATAHYTESRPTTNGSTNTMPG